MARWEYKVADFGEDGFEDQDDWLNSYGQEGWDLVTVTELEDYDPIAYFKREIE